MSLLTVIGARADQFSFEKRNRSFDILDFGAVGDGETLNTEAFQKAFDVCSKSGGGLVRVPEGRYVTGTVALKSGVILSLDYGAEILGSTDLKDYPTKGLRRAREGNSECLFYAEDAQNIRLEGMGLVDGRGFPASFPKRGGPGGKDQRPRLIRFENCEQVTFSGLTYKNPAFWGIHLVDCKDVVFDGVVIRFHQCHQNNDGLDIDGCERVLIQNCDIKAGDDAICLKSSLGPCRDVVVRDCKVSSHTASLKFGTSSRGGFVNVDVSNCYFYDSPMGAIKLQIVDGGTMENITISRIVMKNVGCPLFIRLGNRGRSYGGNTHTGPDTGSGKAEGVPVGKVKGIQIRDIYAEVNYRQPHVARHKRTGEEKKVEPSELKPRERAQAGPIMIAGIPEHLIEDVLLENVKISFPGLGTEEEAQNIPGEDEARYPEQFFFGVLPSWGAYIRHAKDIRFKNVELSIRGEDERERLILDDVEGFEES